MFSVKLGRKHPDQVVETASLSSVEPTDVWYKTVLPEETINTGRLSALQVEAVVYAAQAHSHLLPDGTRAGFLIGLYNNILYTNIYIQKFSLFVSSVSTSI